MKRFAAIVCAALVAACGGSKETAQTQEPTVDPGPAAAPASTTDQAQAPPAATDTAPKSAPPAAEPKPIAITPVKIELKDPKKSVTVELTADGTIQSPANAKAKMKIVKNEI